MHYGNCGSYCGQDDAPVSKADRKALLEETRAILEAKLATIKHMLESVDKEEKE